MSDSGCLARSALRADLHLACVDGPDVGLVLAPGVVGRTGDVPRELQNVHADTAGQEREQGYLYPHNFTGHWVRQQYLPDALKDVVYYQYGDNKTEQAARTYWEKIKGQ